MATESGKSGQTTELNGNPTAVSDYNGLRFQREAWLWLTAFFVFSTIAIRAEGSGLSNLVFAALNHNLVYWFAYAVIINYLVSDPTAGTGSSLKLAIWGGGGLMFLAGLTGVEYFDGLAALLIGYVLLKKSSSPSHNAAGLVFLALSANFFWGPLAFVVFKDAIVMADVLLTEMALTLQGYDVVRQDYRLGTGGDHRVMVVGACSSFNNITLAALAAVTALVAVNGKLCRKDILPVVMVCLVMLFFNTIRLAVFASSYDAYLYWHEGDGEVILAMFSTALVFGAAAWIATHRRDVA